MFQPLHTGLEPDFQHQLHAIVKLNSISGVRPMSRDQTQGKVDSHTLHQTNQPFRRIQATKCHTKGGAMQCSAQAACKVQREEGFWHQRTGQTVTFRGQRHSPITAHKGGGVIVYHGGGGGRQSIARRLYLAQIPEQGLNLNRS